MQRVDIKNVTVPLMGNEIRANLGEARTNSLSNTALNL